MKDSEIIPIAEPDLTGNELKYVSDCIKSGWISSAGKFVKEFEEKFSRYCGCKYGAAVSTGTAALHISLVALGIGKNDEVIIPILTYIATANAVAYTGAKPIFVDVEKDTWNINPEKIEEKITKKTKAIIPVHLYGNPCEMDKIMEIARKHSLYVIEDCAEAHGAEYKGKKVGSFGDVACFSFYGNKIITTGEGGMCVSNDLKIMEKIKKYRNHCANADKRYFHDDIGFNYRLTNLQAALGVAQFEKLDKMIEIKRSNSRLYNNLLEGTKNLILPSERCNVKNIFWMYSILVKDENTKNKLIERLKKEGIDTRPFFYPVNQMQPYKTNELFPSAEEISKKGILLPSSVLLKKNDIERICQIIKKVLSE